MHLIYCIEKSHITRNANSVSKIAPQNAGEHKHSYKKGNNDPRQQWSPCSKKAMILGLQSNIHIVLVPQKKSI